MSIINLQENIFCNKVRILSNSGTFNVGALLSASDKFSDMQFYH